ncbi:MAG TPA: lamin tail domain-containing protein, partial [Verrucomicrobiae bacterium]
GTNINSGQYLVLFASGKNRRIPGARLHTNFKLGTAGNYLGLYAGDLPPCVAHEYAPQYPEQRSDVSFGLDATGNPRYFAIQTPGGPNSTSTLTGAVAAVHYSVGRGFFSHPFAVVLSVPTPGTTIRYTTDGSPPTESSDIYTAPLAISRTTTLRAVVFGAGMLPSLPQTCTYIFTGDVIHQPADPTGFPITTTWSTYGWPSDYAMDQNIVNDPLYNATIENDLLALPALSIVMRTDDMFGAANGLYTHADNLTLEVPCSVELINPDGSPGFQCDAGVRMHGGGSRLRTLKHPFRLLFQGKYGPPKLDYPFFPDSPVTKFDQIDLRSDYNDHWTHGFDASQRARGGLVRDAFFKDLHARMGAFSSHSRYVHLYINGLYWGVYNPCERPDAGFAASYLGGDKADYDAFNGTGPQLVDGTTAARNAMLSLNNTNLASLSQYEQIQQYLDVPQYIDYMIGQLYGANWDWGTVKNWYAVRRRQPGAGFQYLYWDSERTLEGLNDQVNVSPDNLQANLAKNVEYRLTFADHVQKHFFDGGALTPDSVAATWRARAAQIDRAIVGESARWGDSVPNGKVSLSPLPYPSYATGTPYTRDENWLGEQGRLLTNYFPFRSGVVLTQFMQAGLYPRVTAPAFSQHGGRVPAGFNLTMTPAASVIYYTTDGSDPRLYNLGTPAPSARLYSGGIALTNNVAVKARVLSTGTWSALTEATFLIAGMGVPIRITELMYHPVGGEAFEFIELQNVGALPVDMSGFSFQNVTYIFPNGTVLAPGAVMVLSSALDPAAFALRYPGVVVAGTYGGQLSNSGERIALLDQYGRTITSVSYGTTGGWPPAADGGGYSLELINPNGNPTDPANWRASTVLNGSPGLVNQPAALPAVRLNELMADNASAVTNGGVFPDWLELYNANAGPVSLASWSLSNSGDPRKFVFPAGASLPGNGYLVVWCDTLTNAPGLHTSFTLGRKGESLFLYDNLTNRIDAVGFGLQPPNFSLGRIGPAGNWQLTLPTPSSNNVAAALAPATHLVINEWLANSVPGSSDWLEVFNRSPGLPVALSGLFFGTTSNLFQLRSLSFVGPGGFAQFFADEKPGPDHLDFKLSASGDVVSIFDATSQRLDSVTFGAQVEGVSQGRLPDGSANILSFPGTASPGASNYVLSYTGPVLNELMARNVSAVYGPGGHNSDWVELHNPGATDYPLAGMSLSTDSNRPLMWAFPAGVSIPAGSFRVIWCDSSLPPSTNATGPLNTGFALNAQGGALWLFNANGQPVDSVAFGFQVADLSIGRSSGSWALLSAPTPGFSNEAPATLGNPVNLRINEWMPAPLSGNNWFELYNTDTRPVSLAGLYLTDDPSITGLKKFSVPALSFIAGNGWVKYEADAHPSLGPDHVNFSLDRLGETLRLYDSSLNLIDAVDFGLQADGVSQGRLPDGAPNIVSFVSTPTPDASNYLPLPNVLVNEVLTHTDPPLEDAIELFNPGTTDVVLDDWFISNSQADFRKYRIPAGTVLPAGGYKVFYEYRFNSTNASPFTFNSAHGDSVLVSEADSLANLTGYRAQVAFGAAENGVSFGRFVTSAGADFVPLAAHTFGADNPTTVTQFRTGSGSTNSYPKVGPVVISEIMYHPVTASGTNLLENPNEEFVEVFNLTPTFVPLYDPAAVTNCWKLGGGINFEFPAGTLLPAGGYLVVVGFDPVVDVSALANFRAKYGLGTNTAIFGPFSGRLNNAGESVELYKPDHPQTAPHPDAGFVPYLLVDRIAYSPVLPWPTGADGTGNSLQRRIAVNYGNEPLNWVACVPTPGTANCGVDTDGDGLPDAWEIAHGLDPNSASGDNGAAGDPDGDRFTNLEEYLAGTDPRDPASYLRIESASPVAEGVALRFAAMVSHSYTIQYRDDLNAGGWLTLGNAGPFGENTAAQIIDPSGFTHPARFYRLVTPAIP